MKENIIGLATHHYKVFPVGHKNTKSVLNTDWSLCSINKCLNNILKQGKIDIP